MRVLEGTLSWINEHGRRRACSTCELPSHVHSHFILNQRGKRVSGRILSPCIYFVLFRKFQQYAPRYSKFLRRKGRSSDEQRATSQYKKTSTFRFCFLL